jgi:hypothetical protein
VVATYLETQLVGASLCKLYYVWNWNLSTILSLRTNFVL